jgi:glycolate oxidase
MLFDAREPGVMENAMAAAAELMEECALLGGTLSGEHGIGLEKKEFMPLVYTDADMAAMQRVREAFAPQNRLNPGKIFPDGSYYRPAPHPARHTAGLYA